jgi:poly-gamma-glutamate capsule biosynthesis protein CapA/YwtB (metallophosphatase superfamily)
MGQHAAASAWQAQLLEEVKDFNFTIVRISKVQPTTVQVRCGQHLSLVHINSQDVANTVLERDMLVSGYLSNCLCRSSTRC